MTINVSSDPTREVAIFRTNKDVVFLGKHGCGIAGKGWGTIEYFKQWYNEN